jgi:hypothetical protein
MQIIKAIETVGFDDQHPEKYCASGHGQFEKCPRFMDRTVKWPFLPDTQQPFCDLFTRDLVADGTFFLRDARCLRDFGTQGAPGICRHIEEEQRLTPAESLVRTERRPAAVSSLANYRQPWTPR